MRIIVADPDSRLREIIRYALATHLGTTEIVVVDPGASSLTEASPDILTEGARQCLVLTAETALTVWREELRGLRDRIRVIICDNALAEAERSRLKAELGTAIAGFVEKPNIIDPTINLVRALLKQFSASQDTSPSSSYVAIAQQILEEIDLVPANIFLRTAGDKFIRVLSAGDRLTQPPLTALKNNAGACLWISAADAPRLAEIIEAWLRRLQTTGRKADKTNDLRLSIGAQQILMNMFNAMGFTTEVQQASRLVIQSVLAQLESEPRIAHVIALLSEKHDSYLCAHSMVLAHLACAVSKAMGWDSDFTLRKLATAGIMHDLTLKSEQLARLRTIDELGQLRAAGNQDDATTVEDHPMASAQLIRSMVEFPPGADVIVEQHHVLPNGTGLTSNHGLHKIDPLSALFIILHDLVDRAFERGPDCSMAGLLAEMAPDYVEAPFARPFNAIRSFLNPR